MIFSKIFYSFLVILTNARRIDRLSNFSQFHSYGPNEITSAKNDQFGTFQLTTNDRSLRTDQRIGDLLAKIINYKQFKTTNEKEELLWIYSNMLLWTSPYY